MRKTPLIAVTLSLVALTACDKLPFGHEEHAGPNFSLGFASETTPVQTSPQKASGQTAVLGMEGSNGTLQIESVHLIVSEFKLKQTDDACEASSSDPHSGGHSGSTTGCADVSLKPYFLNLPLGNKAAITVGEQSVPSGVYRGLKLKIRDLEADEHDSAEVQKQVQDLLAQIRQQFPTWPNKASLRVKGTFTPKAAEGSSAAPSPVPFERFFDAKVYVKLHFDPALQVTEEAKSIVTVEVSPERWFRHADGTVTDLSTFHCEGGTCGLIRFEDRMHMGFKDKVKHHTKQGHSH